MKSPKRETDEPTLNRRSYMAGLGAGLLGVSRGRKEATEQRRYNIGVTTARARRAARRKVSAVHREIDVGNRGSVVTGTLPQAAANALARTAGVTYVELDEIAFPTAESLPWGINRIDADVVHDRGVGGETAHIVIIDTGIDKDHPDLAANLGEGYSFVTSDTTAWDDPRGHGTHVAGTAAAVSENGVGVVGVAPKATLHAARVFRETGGAYHSDIAAALAWCVEKLPEWGNAVANMSLGSYGDSSTFRNACQNAYENGVVVVSSAGNEFGGAVTNPAAYPDVIAVGATTSSDSLASFSSEGPNMELVAPGRSIRSTLPGGGYGYYNGTSMAAPHVAGAAGVLAAYGLSNTDIRTALQETAEDIGLSENEQGYGLVDVEALVGSLSPSIDSVLTRTLSTFIGAEYEVLWNVSDPSGGLEELSLQVLDRNGFTYSQETVSLSGSSQTGTTVLTVNDTGDYIIRLRLTNTAGVSVERELQTAV